MIRIVLALSLILASPALAAVSLDLATPVQSKVVRKIQIGGFTLYTGLDGTDVARVVLRTVGGGENIGEYSLQLTDVAGTCSVIRRTAKGDDVEVIQGQLGAGVLSGLMDVMGAWGKNAGKGKREAAILTYLLSAGVISNNLTGTVN